jgi:hypothetical protein
MQTFITERAALAQCNLTISYVSIRVIHNPDKLVYLALGIVQESDGRWQPASDNSI